MSLRIIKVETVKRKQLSFHANPKMGGNTSGDATSIFISGRVTEIDFVMNDGAYAEYSGDILSNFVTTIAQEAYQDYGKDILQGH